MNGRKYLEIAGGLGLLASGCNRDDHQSQDASQDSFSNMQEVYNHLAQARNELYQAEQKTFDLRLQGREGEEEIRLVQGELARLERGYQGATRKATETKIYLDARSEKLLDGADSTLPVATVAEVRQEPHKLDIASKGYTVTEVGLALGILFAGVYLCSRFVRRKNMAGGS